MMSFRSMLLQISLTLALACLCSSFSREWLKGHPILSTLPKDCTPQSCSDVKPNQICECDEECSTYGTCCIDSPYATVTPRKPYGIQAQCSEVYGFTFAAYMVSNCSPTWQMNPYIRELCENPRSNDRDPLSMIPVTNPSSGRTYKNFFCSLCNFENRGSVLWNVLLEFDPQPKLNSVNATPAERQDMLGRLEFDGSINSWGIRNLSGGGDRDFIRVSISAKIPPNLQSFVRRCNTMVNGLESQCATTWNDRRTIQMCESYLSRITVPVGDNETKLFVNFRNPHCALCNYVTNFEKAFCLVFFSIIPPSLSFTILLDVNPADGDRVAETSSCAKNEVYDPFFKKCRALVCAVPGYVMKNDRCGPA